jgi:hypothetical protein
MFPRVVWEEARVSRMQALPVPSDLPHAGVGPVKGRLARLGQAWRRTAFTIAAYRRYSTGFRSVPGTWPAGVLPRKFARSPRWKSLTGSATATSASM